MDKDLILNHDSRAGYMIGDPSRVRIEAETGEIKRSRYPETFSAPNTIFRNGRINGVLRRKRPQGNATWGLPKCREAYGNGVPIVTDT